MKLLCITCCFLVLLLSLIVFTFAGVAHAEPGLQSPLIAISGQGTGHVSVSPTARDRGETFHAQVTVNVQGATEYHLHRHALRRSTARWRLH
jgi:hypothetical protein